jgi:hypothetical protein
METAALPAADLDRIKNFARFWQLLANHPLLSTTNYQLLTFPRFMSLSDALLARFGRNWGIDKTELTAAVCDIIEQ